MLCSGRRVTVWVSEIIRVIFPSILLFICFFAECATVDHSTMSTSADTTRIAITTAIGALVVGEDGSVAMAHE